MEEEKAILYPESFFSGLKKGSKEYLDSKALCRGIERDFNESFNPEARIPARIKVSLLDYGIISAQTPTIDSKIHDYIRDRFWSLSKDLSFDNLLRDVEKEFIRNFRTPSDEVASGFDFLMYISTQVEALFLDIDRNIRTPKGEAAFRYYFATRRPEELGEKCVRNPNYYKKLVQYWEGLCKECPYDYYKKQPKTEYWQLVWDAMEYSEFSTFTSTKIKKEGRLGEELNLQPLDPLCWDSPEWWSPKEFTRLKVELIKEARAKHIDENIYDVETIEELLRQMEWDFLDAIIQKNNKVRQRLKDYRTFLIAFFLRNKRKRAYDYYLQRAKRILGKLERIRLNDDTEEFEYLDLKVGLEGDLLFTCVFHDYVRGGERDLRIPRGKGRPKTQVIKEALVPAKVGLLRFADFGVKNWVDKGVLILNALAREEIYSTKPYIRTATLSYDKGKRLGFKYKGSWILWKELQRIKKKTPCEIAESK